VRGDGWARPVSRSAPVKAEERKGRREEGEGGTDKWGQCVSNRGKKKKRRKRRRAAAGQGEWVGGPTGLEREVRSFSIFFFFLFQTLLKFKPFQLKFIQNFSKLFKKFDKPF
jgi:hypothetical protein